MTNGLYELLLHEISTIPHVNVIKDGMVDNEGYDTELAEIVVGFDTRLKHGLRGRLLRKTEPIVNLKDIRRRIRYALHYFPTEANSIRLEYREKKESPGQKLLDKVVISTTPLFI